MPTAAPGDLAPGSGLLEVAGSNTNTLGVNVSVITYGSVHQGGYVFAIDDDLLPVRCARALTS